MKDSNLTALIERSGSQVRAASMIGVTVRHVQKWCCGHSQPSRRSRKKILMFLEGDQPVAREGRLQLYEARVAQGQSPFG